MNGKKVAFVFWGIFILIFIFSFLDSVSEVQINPNDYARITDVEYTAVVVDEPDIRGKVVITERLTFDIHAASRSNLFWELWRDLPEDYVDGLKVDYKVNSVKQLMPDGSEIIYAESPKLYWEDEDYLSTNLRYGPGKWYHSEGPYSEEDAQYECVFFYVDGLYREEVVFEIEYEMYNAALRYKDCSDLYLSLYSESTINHLESFKAQILFPNKDMPARGNYEVHTYGTNSNGFPVRESSTINPGYYTFYFELDEKDLQFKPYNEYIEFDLVSYGRDRHIFTEYAPANDYSHEDVLEEIRDEQQTYANAPANYKRAKTIVFLFLAAGSAYLFLYAFRTDARMKLKHVFFVPAVAPKYYREIPSDLDPNFAAALVFSKHKTPKDDSGIYSAILLSLARKKYIELKEWHNDDTMIILNKRRSKATPGKTTAPSSSYGAAQATPPVSTMAAGITDTVRSTVVSDTTETAGAPGATIAAGTTGTTETVDTSGATIAAGAPGTTIAAGAFVATAQAFEKQEVEERLEPLTLCERYYYNLLIRHVKEDRIMMSYFQKRVTSDHLNTDAFAKNIMQSVVNIGVNDGYFQKADYTQPKKELLSTAKKLLIIGILFITLVNIISNQTRMEYAFGGYSLFGISCILVHFLLKIQANKYVLLTQFGENEYAKWRGLYNFLNSETLISERTLVELPLWEKYLVYATAFGISEKVIKAINIRCPEVLSESEESSNTILSNNYYRSGRYRRHGRSFRSSVRSGSRTAHSSSYGGGSFGYGGGGRGGGGGGGGH